MYIYEYKCIQIYANVFNVYIQDMAITLKAAHRHGFKTDPLTRPLNPRQEELT
jgi:hypothetical protein